MEITKAAKPVIRRGANTFGSIVYVLVDSPFNRDLNNRASTWLCLHEWSCDMRLV